VLCQIHPSLLSYQHGFVGSGMAGAGPSPGRAHGNDAPQQALRAFCEEALSHRGAADVAGAHDQHAQHGGSVAHPFTSPAEPSERRQEDLPGDDALSQQARGRTAQVQHRGGGAV
jgi:hypothetical protein